MIFLVHFDDLGFASSGFNRHNREAMAEYIASCFDSLKQHNASEAWLNDMDDIYRGHFMVFKTFDMAAEDPVYRQLIVDMNGELDELAVSFY